MREQISDLYSANPARPPDWRFLLAEFLAGVDPTAPIRAWDDPIIDRTARVLRGEITSDDDDIIVAALQMRKGSVLDRAELEARIVANQPHAEIAVAMGLSAKVSTTFEDLFFDVRGRAQTCPRLFLPNPKLPIILGDTWALLMLAAIRPGPVSVGWVAWYFRAGLDDVRINTVVGLSVEQQQCAKSVRKWVRSKTLSTNPLTIMKTLHTIRRTEMRAEARERRRHPAPPAPPLAVD